MKRTCVDKKKRRETRCEGRGAEAIAGGIDSEFLQKLDRLAAIADAGGGLDITDMSREEILRVLAKPR